MAYLLIVNTVNYNGFNAMQNNNYYYSTRVASIESPAFYRQVSVLHCCCCLVRRVDTLMKQYGDLEDEFRLALRIEASRFNEVGRLATVIIVFTRIYVIVELSHHVLTTNFGSSAHAELSIIEYKESV